MLIVSTFALLQNPSLYLQTHSVHGQMLFSIWAVFSCWDTFVEIFMSNGSTWMNSWPRYCDIVVSGEMMED